MMPELRVVKNHIILPLLDPDAFAKVFPTVKTAKVNGSYVAALPFDVKSVRLLKNRGYTLPSLLASYNWPGKFTPYAHQKVTTDFFVVNPRAYCLSGMGTCKTASALWATDFLTRQGEVNKTLIVAPLSTLDRVWAQEIFHVLPHRKFHILHGSRDKRLALLKDGKADFYIINHDGVEIIFDALAKRSDINHLIVDEAATYRNSRAKRSKTLFQILNRQGIVRSAWGLTGTPTPNAPTDCFGQIRLLTPERYLGGFRTIQNELMTQVSQFKWVPKHGSAERVYELMQPSIRFALEDCIDLPPTIYQERECELTPQQQKHYKEMERQCFTEVSGQSVSAVNAGVLLGKLVQASLGFFYSGDGSTVDMDFSPRLKVLKEVIEECDEKVIVFVPYTGALNRFYDELKTDWSVSVVDGSVSAGKRNAIFKSFQEEVNPRVILAHPGTMAHGLTLTAATTIVWAAPVTSTETFLQANARISRPGQTKTAHIVMLWGSKVESRLYQTLKDRRSLQDLVLKLAKEKKELRKGEEE